MRLYLVLDVVVNMLINVLTVSLNLFLNDIFIASEICECHSIQTHCCPVLVKSL